MAAGYALSKGLGVARTQVTGPFLSGGVPREHAVSRFHVHWYVVTLLFLAFDMEMVFMYPWAVVVAEVGTEALVEMGVFLEHGTERAHRAILKSSDQARIPHARG